MDVPHVAKWYKRNGCTSYITNLLYIISLVMFDSEYYEIRCFTKCYNQHMHKGERVDIRDFLSCIYRDDECRTRLMYKTVRAHYAGHTDGLFPSIPLHINKEIVDMIGKNCINPTVSTKFYSVYRAMKGAEDACTDVSEFLLKELFSSMANPSERAKILVFTNRLRAYYGETEISIADIVYRGMQHIGDRLVRKSDRDLVYSYTWKMTRKRGCCVFRKGCVQANWHITVSGHDSEDTQFFFTTFSVCKIHYLASFNAKAVLGNISRTPDVAPVSFV